MERHEERDAHTYIVSCREHELVSQLRNQAADKLHQPDEEWLHRGLELVWVSVDILDQVQALLELINQLHVQEHAHAKPRH